VVLSGVDTLVAEGASVALVGPNGGGKSTLLKTFAGLIAPLAGGLEVLGGAPLAATSRIAYLGQHHRNSLNLPIRAVDVVRMARFDQRHRLARRTPVDDECVNDAILAMGIGDLAERPLRDLSGGQQQRVFIAQVLARRARLMLLDEPANALDSVGRAAYGEALRAARADGAGVVISTHDVAEAAACDRVLLVSGRLIADGPPAEVLTPELLLETFGIGLTRSGDRLVVTEHHHDH
jgi:ABC-type Mn2+/Zn2+ transport system ATPase subunit